MNIEPIAYYHSSLPTKFGVPRQSGLVPELVGYVSFMPQYRNSDSLRGIEGFDYLWLIWGFSLNDRKSGAWSPLVRPPLLGGNEYMGVFATRSPFRPNPLGLSSVRLIGVEEGREGVMLIVAGADLVDLLHTDQVCAACAIVVGNQGKTVGKRLIKQNVAGHDAYVGIGSACLHAGHVVIPFCSKGLFGLVW